MFRAFVPFCPFAFFPFLCDISLIKEAWSQWRESRGRAVVAFTSTLATVGQYLVPRFIIIINHHDLSPIISFATLATIATVSDKVSGVSFSSFSPIPVPFGESRHRTGSVGKMGHYKKEQKFWKTYEGVARLSLDHIPSQSLNLVLFVTLMIKAIDNVKNARLRYGRKITTVRCWRMMKNASLLTRLLCNLSELLFSFAGEAEEYNIKIAIEKW